MGRINDALAGGFVLLLSKFSLALRRAKKSSSSMIASVCEPAAQSKWPTGMNWHRVRSGDPTHIPANAQLKFHLLLRPYQLLLTQ